ncbi:MAG: hypothetical protein A2X64_00515 [Ignavibacteria bacterium GWF2_33_9]|nr:MAG: hypothetical protein A2X64_00515 [Ignavibacteria bacterium GWF2_33_9]
MAQISYIKYTDVLEARRYDADFFMPVFLEMDKRIRSGISLINIAKTVDLQSNGAFADIFATLNDGNKKVIPYIRSSNVGDFFLNKTDLEFISKEAHSKLKKTHTENQDVLMARKGKIGGATIIFPEDMDLNTNDNVVNIKVIDERFNPFFVTTFLNSKYGLLQVNRFATGNVQPWLSMYQVRILKIPLLPELFQLQIEQIVKSAHQKQTQSKKLYKEAEEILLRELGLLDYEVKHSLWFTTTKKEIDNAKRYDSEYFQPKYDAIIKKIEKYEGGWDLVKESVNFKDKNYNPKLDRKYKYLALSNISSQGYVQDFQEEFGKDLPTRARRKINTGDLIISSIEGSLSSCALIEQEFDNSICSTGFFVINSDKINSETLLILFKSDIIQELLQRGSKGTILTAISKTELESIKIPLINEEIQKEIAEKIQVSHKLRKESKELLEKAKKAVEIAIEENEATAMEYLK